MSKDAIILILDKVSEGKITNEEAKVLLDAIYNNNSYKTTYIPYYPYKYETGTQYNSPYKITCNDDSGNYKKYNNDEITAFQ